jgi:hypothetical protein
VSPKRWGKTCKKCGDELIYYEPSISFSHCGTDYWTILGERRLYPHICMACRSKIGKKAQAIQSKSL